TVTVGEGPGNGRIALPKGSSVVGYAGDNTNVAVVVRCRRRRQVRRTLSGNIRQATRIWYGRRGVVHMHRLGLSAAVTVTVGEGPRNSGVTSPRGSRVGRRARDGSVAVVVCRRSRRQVRRTLIGHIRQAGRIWHRCRGVVHRYSRAACAGSTVVVGH